MRQTCSTKSALSKTVVLKNVLQVADVWSSDVLWHLWQHPSYHQIVEALRPFLHLMLMPTSQQFVFHARGTYVSLLAHTHKSFLIFRVQPVPFSLFALDCILCCLLDFLFFLSTNWTTSSSVNKLIRIDIAIKFLWAYPRGDKPIPNSGWQLPSGDWIPTFQVTQRCWVRVANSEALSLACDPSHEIRKRLEMVLLLSSSTSIVSLK